MSEKINIKYRITSSLLGLLLGIFFLFSLATAEAAPVLDSGIDSAGTVTNSDDITVKVEGETVTGAARSDAYVEGNGIKCVEEGTVTNHGAITVTATGGTAKATEHSWAFGNGNGIKCEKGGMVTNHGAITVTATGGTATATATTDKTNIEGSAAAYGINNKEGTVINHGNITVTAKGESATVTVLDTATGTGTARAIASGYGIKGKGVVENYGAITVDATGGIATARGTATAITTGTAKATARASAYGIYIDEGGEVINSGAINVTSQAGTQTIGCTTTSASNDAYGIYFFKGGELSSSGLIRASGRFAPDEQPPPNASPRVYQVFNHGGVLRIEQYAMEVGPDQDTFTAMYSGQIGTSDGAKIVFDHTELVVHLAKDAEKYQDGVYDIPRLWKRESDEGNVPQPDQFATAVTAVPDLNVSLIPASAENLQQIKLEYAPKESIPLKQTLISLQLEEHIHSIIHDDLTSRILFNMVSGEAQTNLSSSGINGSTSTMVASLSNPEILSNITAESSKQHSLFFRPVYVNSYDCASSGYSSNTYGFVLGYNYKIYPDRSDALIGMHAGYTRGDVRYTGARYGDTKEFVDTYYGGFHGATLLAESVLLSGEASFFYADSDVRDDNPAVLGKADYESVAIRAEVEVGYLWMVEGYSIIPEIGLAYSWQHRDSFTADNKNSPDIHYGTLDNNELYANARLKWLKRYDISESWTITPLVGVGVTQVLTDGEFSNSMRLGNETQMVVDQDENTTFTPVANLTISSDDCYAIVGYTGGFGGTTHNNMFWLQMGYNF